MTRHTPLHEIDRTGPCSTAGRLHLHEETSGAWTLESARGAIALSLADDDSALTADDHRSLARVHGNWDGAVLHVERLELFAVADPRPPRESLSTRGICARARALAQTRSYFQERGFLEVTTPALVDEPGTDVYLEPFSTTFVREDDVTRPARQRAQHALQGYLHTSPEFMMKRMLGQGFERIWQLSRAWRNGEVSPLHAPEFTCLEWYRAWEPLERIIEDTETLIRRITDGEAVTFDAFKARHVVDTSRPFARVTMRQLVQDCCGFDLLEALDAGSLAEAIYSRGLLRPREAQKRGRSTSPMYGLERIELLSGDDHEARAKTAHLERLRDVEQWLDLFFELQVTHLDEHLAGLGAVVLTEWPSHMAVLAAKKEGDARVADRFEIYVGGVECANGFRELTDATEQRERFAEDLEQRLQLARPAYPMPHKFLRAMEKGMPPSSGVAMGFDRVVMLATGAQRIDEVLPFAMRRGREGGAEFG